MFQTARRKARGGNSDRSSVPYRAARSASAGAVASPARLRSYNEILRGEESFKSAKVRRDKRATRGEADREVDEI